MDTWYRLLLGVNIIGIYSEEFIYITIYFIRSIHDRKLCVLGLCTLITMGDAKPIVLGEISDKIIPSLILIFDGLKRAYQARAQADEEEETDEDDDECEGITKANNCVSLAI